MPRADLAERLNHDIQLAKDAMEEARLDYVRMCRSLANNFNDAAVDATRYDKTFGYIVSGTAVSSSLIQDIPRAAEKYQTLKLLVARLEELV